MRTIFSALILLFASVSAVSANIGFTEPSVLLYGRVVQNTGGTPHLLQNGSMTLVLRNTDDAANTVTLDVTLAPTGTGDPAAFSYAVPLPLKVDPPAYELDEFIDLAPGGVLLDVVSVSVNGEVSTVANETDRQIFIAPEQRGLERRFDILAGGEAIDSNGDGIPDWWLDFYELTGDDRLAGTDTDGDGLGNLEEFELGTNPTASNVDPLLLTRETSVTREGVAGMALRVVDADTAPGDVSLILRSLPAGIEVRRAGTPLAVNATFSAADLEAGLLQIVHASGSGGVLGLTIDDETPAPKDVDLQLTVFDPSPTGSQQAALWLDARSLALSPGDPVGAWEDRSGRLDGSGTPRAFVQGDGVLRPQLESTTVGDAVRFDSGAHLLGADASLPATTRALFVLHAATGTEAAPQSLLQSNAMGLELAPFDGPVGYPGAATLAIQSSRIESFRTPLAEATLHAFRLTDSGGFALSRGLYDGSLDAGEANNAPVIPALGATVSLDPFDPTQREIDRTYRGDLFEVLLYDSLLPDRFAESVENYLLSRWKDAVIWDLAESLTGMTVAGSAAPDRMIGGFGADAFDGGDGPDILSGGPGVNQLTGGAGPDIFRYRQGDTGNDTLTDFDPSEDHLDLSARLSGLSGDVADYLSLTPRVEVVGSEVVVFTELGLHLGGDTSAPPDQLLLLQGIALNQSSLGLLVGEGALVVGDLLAPQQMGLNSLAVSLRDAPGNRVVATLTRSGNTTHREEVPLSFSGSAVAGMDFSLVGTSGSALRPTAIFERGESSTSFGIVIGPDPLDEPTEAIEVAIVPRPRNYQVTGTAGTVEIAEAPRVTLTAPDPVIEVLSGGTGTLRVERSGSLDAALEVGLITSGTAQSGTDYVALPSTVLLPVGQSFVELPITPLGSATAGGSLEVSLEPGSADFTPALPATARFQVVTRSFADWRDSNDPGASSVPLATYATQDRNGDGISNFEEYIGGLIKTELTLDPNGETLTVVAASDLPDQEISLQTTTDLSAPWQPDIDAIAAGVDPNHPDGVAFHFQRTEFGPGSDDRFFRGTATFRDPVAALNAPEGLFDADPLPAATGGDLAWQPTSGDGYQVSGLPAGGRSSLTVAAEGPGGLDFEWRHNGDPETSLRFFMNGELVAELNAASPWTQVSLPLEEGTQVLSWTFSNQAATAAGDVGLRGIRIVQP
jgi:hypothetical protein